MSKYKKGIVEDIKKEQIFEENQQHLKDKYKMTGEKVVIVEKNNFLKYLVKYSVFLCKIGCYNCDPDPCNTWGIDYCVS